jgi:hypothetical protein
MVVGRALLNPASSAVRNVSSFERVFALVAVVVVVLDTIITSFPSQPADEKKESSLRAKHSTTGV